MSRAVLVGWLTVIWVALWGSVTPANVLGGLAAAAVLLVVFPVQAHPAPTHVWRPVAALRFAGYFLYKLIEANLVVAWEILTPRSGVNEGIVEVPVRGCSDGLITLLANVIGLTPGTITLEVEDDPTRIYVHVLHLHDIEKVRRDLLHLEALLIRAFGSPYAVGLLDELPEFAAERAQR